MGLLRKRSWWQILAYSRLMLVVLVVLSVAVSFAVYDRYVVEREMASRRYENEKELVETANRKQELVDKIEYLKGEQGMEAEIRRHFDVARDGEQVIVLTGEAAVLNGTASPSHTQTKTESWWQRFLTW